MSSFSRRKYIFPNPVLHSNLLDNDLKVVRNSFKGAAHITSGEFSFWQLPLNETGRTEALRLPIYPIESDFKVSLGQ